MKQGDVRRKVLYLFFGVLPSLCLLPLPVLFVQAPFGAFFLVSLLAIGGCVGLGLAVVYPPSRDNSRISPLIALLVTAGSVVAGALFLGVFLSLFWEPSGAFERSFILLALGAPLLVAAHYLLGFVRGWAGTLREV